MTFVYENKMLSWVLVSIIVALCAAGYAEYQNFSWYTSEVFWLAAGSAAYAARLMVGEPGAKELLIIASICGVIFLVFKLINGDFDLLFDLENEIQVWIATIAYLVAFLLFCLPFGYLFWKINQKNSSGG